jgi:hypothetical protein
MSDVVLVLKDVEYCERRNMIRFNNETLCLPENVFVAVYSKTYKYVGEIHRYDGTSYKHFHFLGDLYANGEIYILMPNDVPPKRYVPDAEEVGR